LHEGVATLVLVKIQLFSNVNLETNISFKSCQYKSTSYGRMVPFGTDRPTAAITLYLCLIIKLIFFRSHHFDTVQRLSNKPKRKSGIISSFGKPAKGAEGARAFHKANEEKIMSHTSLKMKIKNAKNTFIALRCFLFIMSRGVLVKTRHFQLTSLCFFFK
jgi:hypothetical protein